MIMSSLSSLVFLVLTNLPSPEVDSDTAEVEEVLGNLAPPEADKVEEEEEINELQHDLASSSSYNLAGDLIVDQLTKMEDFQAPQVQYGAEGNEDIGENLIALPRQSAGRCVDMVGNLNSVCGYRFSPNDYELIIYYLAQKILGMPRPLDIIQEIDVYKCDPEQLPIDEFKHALPGEAYFFTRKVRKHSNKSSSRRTIGTGYWKATDKETIVTRRKKCVGYKKTMVFYRGKAPKGKRTHWIMDEYRVNASLFPNIQRNERLKSNLENYVVCRIRRKSKSSAVSIVALSM
ncbi:NAC domain-containing protein 83 isoform X2 [Ricinus communis]|uniref:NAC domain-containing protein 83 isoform X2 n=1 Tax=Ricinus communis TaxID=3988 RepID=UPI00201AE8C9|nr:NAC domain-containing protein 83 isoform X2 [Ricinus communis]